MRLTENDYGRRTKLFDGKNPFDSNRVGVSYIEESYQVLDQLNPKLWQQDGTLRPEVKGKLFEIQDEFIKELNENNIPVAVLDAWIVGSNASYNYTDQSDLDLHIIVDSSASSCDAAVLQILYNYFKSNFNSKYDISIHGIDVELYIEDVNSNAVSNGIYSLQQDKWIKKPIKTDIPEVQIDSELLQKWVDKYNNVVAGVSAQTAQSLVNELYLLRKQSLATEGEYGQGNLIFKEFRNNGYLDKLKEIAAGDKSKELSLESRKLKGDVSMKNTLYEAIINNASREIRCYDRTTGEELCFNLEEGVKDGYTLFIKALAEKLNYEGDEFNCTVNLWEFCNNNTDVLEKMFENATTVRECYDSLVQFINEGVSIKEGARLAKCLSSANIITESLKEEKAPSYSTELMQKLTDLPEGSIIEIRNTEGTVDKAFRKVSTSAGIWVCTKEGTAESAYTTDLATDYKDDGWMIDYVQAEGLHRTAIKSVGTKNIKESLYFTLDFDDINNIVSDVVDEVKKKDCVVTADAEYNSDVSTIMLFVTLKNGEEHTNTVNLEKLDTPEQLRRSLKNKFELMTDVCEEQSHKRGKENTSGNSTTNKLVEAPNGKKEVFVYKAMDVNGNGVYKIFYDDGTYEILKGSKAYERSPRDYDKFVSMETLRHATAPPKSAIRQSRRTLGDSKSTVQESVSGDASKLADVLSIAKKIGIETVQELMDFQNRHKGQDLLVALKDYEKEFDAAGEELDENIFTKRKERKELYKEISNIDDIIPTDADNISDDKPNKADSRYKIKVREDAEQKSLYYISYKVKDVYQAILAKASSEQEAKDKVQKKMPNAEILSVRVAYAGDRKPGMPVVEGTLKELNMVEDVFGVRYLYHATYLPYYEEIKKEGKIVAGRHKNWDMSSGCIYLARDEEVAISYAETSENVPEEYLDQIVVLTIDASKLDIESLDIDHNQAYSYDYDYTDTFSVQEFEYTKDIPLEYVVCVTRDDGTPLSNGSVLYDINAKSIMKESTKKYNMDNIKFLGYKPEFIESSKYFPFIQDAIKNDKLYSPQEIDNLLQQATQVACEEDIYAKFYIDVVYSVDGQQKRHHGIRADIDGEYSKGDFMPIHDEIWSYLKDAAKKAYYKVDRRSKMKESYNRYAKETDIEFLKDALAEMRRYERMWDGMSARQQQDIAPEGGLEELQQNIEYAEQRLAELQGAQNEGKQVDEKDYKWKKLKYIKNGQVYGKVGRRIGIAAPTTLPSSEGPIPGPGAEGGDCGGCSESKLSEAVNAEFTEDELEGLLNLVNNFVAEIEDKYISAEDSLGMREVRNTVYSVFDAIYRYLKKEYPDSKLIQKYSLQESTKKCLKEEVDGARTLQEWFENNELDGADVYDSDFDLDGTYVDNIVTPADNYDRFVLYVCNNVEIVEGNANRSYATVDFSGFVRSNMQALLQWLDIEEKNYEDGLEDDDLYEDIINQIIAALQGYGSESQYREFMRIVGQ